MLFRSLFARNGIYGPYEAPFTRTPGARSSHRGRRRGTATDGGGAPYRDGRKPTAQSMSICCRPDNIGRDFRSRSSALKQCSNAAASGDQSHERCRSDMPGSRLCSFARREHNRSLCHRRPDLKPMMFLRWVTQNQIASIFS